MSFGRGTLSRTLNALAWQVLTWCDDLKIVLQATPIPGVTNLVADALSRGRLVTTEWELKESCVQALFNHYGRPDIDLFASAKNAKLPTYCTRFQEDGAWATDALSISLQGLDAYAYPPRSLIPRVISKVKSTGNCRLLLIAPLWPRQPWFRTLSGLLIDLPRRLPLGEDLLTQGPRCHQDSKSLHLVGWKISGLDSESPFSPGSTVGLQ